MTLSAGIMLSEIQNTGDIFTVKQVGGMVILSLLLAIPSSFRSKPQKEEWTQKCMKIVTDKIYMNSFCQFRQIWK